MFSSDNFLVIVLHLLGFFLGFYIGFVLFGFAFSF